jgi:hypothetical protein
MPVLLTIAGALLCTGGLFMIGFAIPIRDFSLGSTLIIAGATSLAGGVLVVGVAAAVRELRKLARSLDKFGQATRQPAPIPAPRPIVAPPPRPLTRSTPANNSGRSTRAEPRLELPAAEPTAEPAATSAAAVVPPPSPPSAAALGAGRQTRSGLFASVRGRAAVAAAIELPPPLPPPSAAPPSPPPPEDEREPPPPELEEEPFVEDQPVTRSPSLSALAARTAARLDLPRPVPDLPRMAADRPAAEPPPEFERAPSERPPVERQPAERPADRPRNMFDTVWPTEQHNPGEPASREEGGSSAPEPRPPEILKSGVIDGMAYTLYTDGSIEAQLPQGTLRFGSIDDLRAHLERTN